MMIIKYKYYYFLFNFDILKMIVDINDEKKLNVSMTKTLFCNHCAFEFSNYEEMKKHYQSQFHLYNLNRVTHNLNPVNYEQYIEKKENCKNYF